MATCPNCNAPLEDDARFCANCGAAIPAPAAETAPAAAETSESAPETIFCPNCGGQTNAAFEYCEHCGAALNAPAGQDANKPGGAGLKKWLVLGAGVVAVAAVVIVLISIFSGGGGGGKGYGLYIKDKEIFYSGLSPKGAWQLTSKLSEDASNALLAAERDDFGAVIVMSKDGRKIFYPDKIDNGFTLYWRNTSGKKEGVKIDSDITRFAVNDSASLVTYLKNGNLYQYDVGRNEKGGKLAGDVTGFYVSDDGKRLIFRDQDNTLYEMESGKDKESLDKDVSGIQRVSSDCKTVVYMKDGTLYLKQSGKDKVRISSDVKEVLRAYPTGEVYYTEDDDDEDILCYFDGKDSVELTDEYKEAKGSSQETPMLVYRIDDEYWLAVGDKTSELDAETPSNFVFSKDGKNIWYIEDPDDDEGELVKVTISGGTVKKTETADDDVYTSELGYTSSGHLYYFKDVSNGSGDLYIDGKKADTDVYVKFRRWSESGAVLYYTDYSTNRGYGTLKQYSGGKAVKVEDDVVQPTYAPNGSILYLADYNDSRARGDLFVFSGSKSTKLDEEVAAIIPFSTAKYRSF